MHIIESIYAPYARFMPPLCISFRRYMPLSFHSFIKCFLHHRFALPFHILTSLHPFYFDFSQNFPFGTDHSRKSTPEASHIVTSTTSSPHFSPREVFRAILPTILALIHIYSHLFDIHPSYFDFPSHFFEIPPRFIDLLPRSFIHSVAVTEDSHIFSQIGRAHV